MSFTMLTCAFVYRCTRICVYICDYVCLLCMSVMYVYEYKCYRVVTQRLEGNDAASCIVVKRCVFITDSCLLCLQPIRLSQTLGVECYGLDPVDLMTFHFRRPIIRFPVTEIYDRSKLILRYLIRQTAK